MQQCVDCPITNCGICKNHTECSDCHFGYYLDLRISENLCCKTEYCETCDKNGEDCTFCTTNYYLHNGYCLKNCVTGFFNHETDDVPVKRICKACTVDNCKDCMEIDKCEECKTDYYLTPGHT